MPDNIKQLLMDMYNRPGAYFGKKSLEGLAFTLSGYMLRDSEISGDSGAWFVGFQEFVEKHYKVEVSRNWVDIIRFFAYTEEEAFDTFYELLGKFLGQSGEFNRRTVS